jgi:hypothetical protein
MSDYVQATLASWSTLADGNGGYTGRVTKKGMKVALDAEPRKVEFNAISTPFQRGGYFFIDEVPGKTIELRYNNDRDLMMIAVNPDGTVKRVS